MDHPLTAIDWIKADEGCRFAAYKDTRGIWTVGWGHTGPEVKDGYCVSQDLADSLLLDALRTLTVALSSTIPTWANLTPTRQAALQNMAYNLGVAGLLKFKHFLAALAVQDWPTAVHELQDSLWAKQVPNRAKRIMTAILEG